MKEMILVLSLICVTTERLTEMVKNVWDAGKHMTEWQYKLYVHVWAAAIGTGITVWIQGYAPNLFPEMFRNWFGCVFLGLVACSGAGVWNSSTSVLEEFSNLKKKVLELDKQSSSNP